MGFNRQDGTSQLFLVRLRANNRGRKQQERKRWCGRVQRVVTGEGYEFCGWVELIRYLGLMLGEQQSCNEIEEKASRKE
jgi:hypothetical protein